MTLCKCSSAFLLFVSRPAYIIFILYPCSFLGHLHPLVFIYGLTLNLCGEESHTFKFPFNLFWLFEEAHIVPRAIKVNPFIPVLPQRMEVAFQVAGDISTGDKFGERLLPGF